MHFDAELKGDGKEAAEEHDDTPLDTNTPIDALTDDDYFRKNAEARYLEALEHMHENYW